MTATVTLYRVRRPDGTVIPTPPKERRHAAVVSASPCSSQLSNLALIAPDEDQKFEDLLKVTGYAIEAVEYAPVNPEREKEMERLIARNKKLEVTCSKMNEEICQILGKALGYPWPKDDPKNFPGATEADGVCVGEHVAESIAEEAARRIRKYDNPEREAAIKMMREALKLYQEAYEPHEHFATGPLTGDPIQDFVVCLGCTALGATTEALAAFDKADGAK